MNWLEFSARLVEALIWPSTVITIAVVVSIYFGDEIRVFLGDVEAAESPWLKLYRLARKAAPESDIPLPPPSSKQRIKAEWQKIHDALTSLYEQKVGKGAPPQYAPLASRLKRRGFLTDEAEALLDETRSIWRSVKRRPESSVTVELADYYAQIVSVVLKVLDKGDS